MRRFRLGLLAFAGLLAITACADVKLPAVFGDGMVLQRNAKIPVWGWAAPGEQVTVTVNDQQAAATADAAGAWRVTLKPMKEGGPYELAVAGKNSLKLKDILIGDVWICSGQSNMEWTVNGTRNAAEEVAGAKFPQIRMFTVTKRIADVPQKECAGSWATCTPQTVGAFSAVGYFFARELHQQLNIPIGMIHTSWGGTPAEAWTPEHALVASPELKEMVDRRNAQFASYSRTVYEQAGTALKAWLAEMEQADRSAGKPLPMMPQLPGGDPRGAAGMPSGLYNGMVHPLVPYAITGSIWYQGENNSGRAAQYRTLFPTMITGWRTAWGQGDFPFYFVQLANFMAVQTQPVENSGWAELREAQAMTLALPNTGMATIIDIGEAGDIHPRNKQDVGKRLALVALAKTYNRKLEYAGPMYAGLQIDGQQARLSFTHVGGGLVAQGGELKGFAIAGADKQFVWADAVIDGNTVVVSSPKVAQPVAVRYNWANNPIGTLFNAAGLPASPFRTDGPAEPVKGY